ncbi:MAG: GAF domain-containing protein [Methylorubrum rhodinum]|uniref:GAF domain-containing protein n=1 Tax=Methylorubrum rhodinum TaxID=29428 RepID=UPI003BB0252E
MIKTAPTAPIPPRQNESRRLAALYRLQLLDTPPEPAFDRITQLAQRLFDVPIALLSLLDEDRQWFKAKCGLDVSGTPREQAFCNYTILHDSVFVVPDAQADAAFSTNPLVTGEPAIRFYAGAPLTVAPETRLGSLCIIDRTPRTFSEDEARLLARLAQIVTDELWLRSLTANTGHNLPSFTQARPGSTAVSMITGMQVRAARAMLNCSIDKLAANTGLSANTIKRVEAGDQTRPSTHATITTIRSILEAQGVVFIGHDAAAPGIQLLKETHII